MFAKIFTRPPYERITTQGILDHCWIRDNASLSDVDFGPEYKHAIRAWVHRQYFKTVLEKKLQNSYNVKSVLNEIFEKNHDARPVITTMQYIKLKEDFLEHQKIIGKDRSILSNSSGVDFENFCRILVDNKFHQFAHEDVFRAFDMDGNGRMYSTMDTFMQYNHFNY